MALLNLVYRDQLFPRRAYARAFEALLARFPNLALAPEESIRWRPNLGLRGLTELHVLAA